MTLSRQIWVYYDYPPNGMWLDSLNQWKSKAKACVDWDSRTEHRREGNIVVAVHTATPIRE